MSPTKRSAAVDFATAFPAFDVVDTHYKSVKGIEIPTSLLIPKSIQPGSHPVIVRWHGGCFITGHRLFPRWFGKWTLEAAVSKMAVIVSPDYRLLPEATGEDILQDLRDLYAWLCAPDALAAHLPDGVLLDVGHLLVMGESAGGWLAVQSGILDDFQSRISGVIARYPMLDLRAGHYAGQYKQDPFETPDVPWKQAALATHLQGLKGDETVTSAIAPDRMPLVMDTIRGGSLSKLLGDDSSLYPLEAVQDIASFPPMCVVHGFEDRLVPVEGTKKFIKELRETVRNVQVHESYRAGSHGFDNDPSISMEAEWIQEGLAFMAPYWPNC